MTDHRLALQTALYDTLSTDAPLIALIGNGASPQLATVYSHTPYGQEGRYITISEIESVENGDKSVDGQRLEITVEAWDLRDTNESNKGILDVLGAVYTALHKVALTIAGGALISINFERSIAPFLDDDLRTWRGWSRFVALIDDS